jgi:peptide/nickel transport system permease protein
VIFKYTLRNAMIPTITISGPAARQPAGRHRRPGVDLRLAGHRRAIFEAILQRDYPMVQAGVLVLGVIVVVMNLLVDLTYRLLNPRVKFG